MVTGACESPRVQLPPRTPALAPFFCSANSSWLRRPSNSFWQSNFSSTPTVFDGPTFEKKRFKCLAIQPCSLAAPPPHLLGDVGPSGAPPHLSVVVVAQYHAASGPRLGPPRNPSRAPWRKGSHPGPQARFQQHSMIYSCFVCVSASLSCPRSLPLSDPVMCSPKSPLPPPRLPMSRPPLPCLPRFARRDTHLDTDRYPPWWPCGSPSQAGEHPFPSLISLANMAITPLM